MSLIKFISSGGAAAGAFWIGDMLNLPDARVAVLAADEGAYVDVYIGAAEIANFICRVQHQIFSTVSYAQIISPFYLSKLGAYDNSVLDLTSAAELEKINGTFGTFSGGIVTAGDFEFIAHFLGTSFDMYREMYMQALVSDATPTAADSSWFGAGLIDTAAKGTNRLMGGSALYLASNYWKTALITSAISRLSTSVYDIWSAVSMPTTPSRLTTGLQASVQNTGTFAAIASSVRVHGVEAEAGGTRVTDANAIAFAPTLTKFGFGCYTAASTTINMTTEVLSPIPLSIPAGGF